MNESQKSQTNAMQTNANQCNAHPIMQGNPNSMSPAASSLACGTWNHKKVKPMQCKPMQCTPNNARQPQFHVSSRVFLGVWHVESQKSQTNAMQTNANQCKCTPNNAMQPQFHVSSRVFLGVWHVACGHITSVYSVTIIF
jgi:hypothetical protein